METMQESLEGLHERICELQAERAGINSGLSNPIISHATRGRLLRQRERIDEYIRSNTEHIAQLQQTMRACENPEIIGLLAQWDIWDTEN